MEMSHADEHAFLGWYSPYAFLIDGKEEHPDLGPLGWVDGAQHDGSLDKCAVQNASSWLLNWETDDTRLDEWTTTLGSDPMYRSLIHTLVTSPEYWGGEP